MIGWAVLAVTLTLFAATALSGREHVAGVEDFLHLDGSRRNAISLGIADVTLGTGLAYVLTASSQFGLAMLALPTGLLVGYAALAALYRRIPAAVLEGRANLLLAVRERADQPARRRLFDLSVTLPLLVVFVLFVSYECFASSQIIAAFVAPGAAWAPAVIGGAIVLVSGINSVVGGAQSNWRNDDLLAGGILLLTAIIVVTFAAAPAPAGAAPAPAWSDVATVTVLGFLAATATQFYSLLNAYNASNFQRGDDAARVFRTVGLTVAGLLAAFVVVGAWRPLDLAAGFPAALGARLAGLHLGAVPALVLTGATIAGMVAVTFSTIDTMFVALTYFIRRHLLDLSTSDPGATAVSSRRIVALLAFGLLPPLAGLYLLDPNLFTLLLALGGGAAVFAPLIAVEGWAMTRPGRPSPPPPALLLAFLALFLGSGVSGAVALSRAPTMVPYLSLGWLGLAIVLAGVRLVAVMSYRWLRASVDQH